MKRKGRAFPGKGSVITKAEHSEKKQSKEGEKRMPEGTVEMKLERQLRDFSLS